MAIIKTVTEKKLQPLTIPDYVFDTNNNKIKIGELNEEIINDLTKELKINLLKKANIPVYKIYIDYAKNKYPSYSNRYGLAK